MEQITSPKHRATEKRPFQNVGESFQDSVKEEYTYQVDKITFIVTPTYKEGGETMRDILLKLMLAELEPA